MLAQIVRPILNTFFREVITEGSENLPLHGPLIFTPNHPNGLLDPMLLQFKSLPFPIRFVAAIMTFRIPVLGWVLRRLRAIPVVRRIDTAGEVDYTGFFATCAETLATGDRLVIFPEGVSLSQPFMAPLRTGPARIFFLARAKGIHAKLIPVGLNYERGEVFRSSVLISIAPPLDTRPYEEMYRTDPIGAVRELTAEIARTLEHHVFQAETYRDRELLLLLARFYEKNPRADWPRRWERMKQFERGLSRLRRSCPAQIDRIRHLLAQYKWLSRTFQVRESRSRSGRSSSLRGALLGGLGMGLAAVGVFLNWLPYRACPALVRLTRKQDAAQAATFKILYSLFLYPLAYGLEGVLLNHWLGGIAAGVFAVTILPLTFFTLRFYEWRRAIGGQPLKVSAWFGGGAGHRIHEDLAQLRRRIVAQVEVLTARPEIVEPGGAEAHASSPPPSPSPKA